MNPEFALQYISNALNLRAPQAKSLKLFAAYLESSAGRVFLSNLKKGERKSKEVIETVAADYFRTVPEAHAFKSFERAFPAYTFALATGVGKTRLMGAFVAYLYLVYGIKHFLIVAPNLTIYRKLVEDFSKARNPKYVFKGIEEINTNTLNIVTTDNYSQNPTGQSLFGNDIQVNIFNIQQFAQKEVEKEKGITKFSETLGESYFDYLAELDDLVVLLDESHHYHADAAFDSLDRMKPLLGLEFTATPYTGEKVGRGKNAVPEIKPNILYGYNLGDAIRDGFVKDPWVGTEADVDFSQFDTESPETDKRKLQLAMYFHERSRVALQEYALLNKVRVVKPVMLVVAKDTTHADELYAYIDSQNFRNGEYKGKVIKVHTKTKGEEADEAIEKLISLEDPDNYVEIVIHVNMLKEGWDVSNIYTIAPLRSSASEILTEQTIGRGLRLPYGERTGDTLVDRVMIVAHEKYSDIVSKAQKSTLIQPTRIEQINIDQTKDKKVVIEARAVGIEQVEAQVLGSSVITEQLTKAAEEALSHALSHESNLEIRQVAIENKKNELAKELARQITEQRSFADFHSQSGKKTPDATFDRGSLFFQFDNTAKEAVENIAKVSAKALETRNIPIPRLVITPKFSEVVINDFVLDTANIPRFKAETKIMEQRLQGALESNLFGDEKNIGEGERKIHTAQLSSTSQQSAENTIIAGLTDCPLIDYEEQKVVLASLAKQAADFYRTFIADEEALKRMVETNRTEIAEKIYAQILTHKELKGDGHVASQIQAPAPYLEPFIITRDESNKPVEIGTQKDTFSRDKIYTGFKRACHSVYKFDSSDEARFAYLLENEEVIEDWLRPAPNQFKGLYWRDAQGELHKYEPDFVAEFAKEVVMVEVKPTKEIAEVEVQAKKQTAEKYCELVSQNVGKFGIIKPWRFVIVPTEKISLSSTASSLLGASS